MLKHADSLDFFQNLVKSRKDKRDDELSNAYGVNFLAPEMIGIPAGLAQNHFAGKAFIDTPEVAHTHGWDELNHILGSSGLDLKPIITKTTSENYSYQPGRSLVNKIFGTMKVPFGRHGNIGKEGMDPDRWNIPALAHEIGHAQTHHSSNLIERLLARSKPLGPLALGGSVFESFRALDDNPRSVDERKNMLNTASGLGGLAFAPILNNEYQASSKGMKLLKNLALENKGEILAAARKTYPKAFSSYALMAAAPVLGPQIAKLFLPKHVD